MNFHICPHCGKSFNEAPENPDAGMEQREQELCDQMEQ